MSRAIEPRSLSPKERALAEFLLSAEFPGRDELKSQLEFAEVVGVCECGCGTVDLAIKASVARAVCREPIPVEAHKSALDVLLFVRNGLLGSIEIVDYEEKRPLHYPRPDDLKLWVPPPGQRHTPSHR
jgi:hypothetical protein